MRIFLFLVAFLVSFSAHARTVASTDVTLYVAPYGSCSGLYWPAYRGGPLVNVTTCGNDTTGNGSQALPYATFQKAADVFMADYDMAGKYVPTIQAAVSYSGQIAYGPVQISGRIVGQAGTIPALQVGYDSNNVPLPFFPMGKYAPFTLRGDPNNPTRAIIFPQVEQQCFSLTETAIKIEGLTCDTALTKQDCVEVFNSFLDIGNAWFGNCGHPVGSSYNLVFGVAWHSTVLFTAPITVSGGAQAFMQIAQSVAMGNSNEPTSAIPINIVNTPTFNYFFIIDASTVYAHTMTFSGAINGKKALVLRGGQLFTNTGIANGITSGGLPATRSCFTNPGTSNFIPGTWNPATDVEDNAVCR